jgi:hypothetical protein
MAIDPIKQKHPAIFLSASIPTSDRPARYFDSADVIAIRDCIKALVAAVVPRFALVWGGHPSITPMIGLLAESSPEDVVDHFVLYQSSTYKNIAPKDNEYFRHVIWVEGTANISESLRALRQRMLQEPTFAAGVFIGGMEGIEREFMEFHERHPNTPIYPVASTGGAAKILYQDWSRKMELPRSLSEEIAYPFLWRQLLAGLHRAPL